MTTSGLFDALSSDIAEGWTRFVAHPFVMQLADGSLPEASFRHYLAQDYLFLTHYARAFALAVVKSDTMEDLRQSAAGVHLLLNHELPLHISFCAGWGLSEADLACVEEAPANRLYTRYVLDRGQSGDLLDLLVALAPCSLGYAEIGRRIIGDPKTRRADNPYRPWIELYGGDDFQSGSAALAAQLDRVATQRGIDPADPRSSARWPALRDTFATATALEVGFWDMGLNPPPA